LNYNVNLSCASIVPYQIVDDIRYVTVDIIPKRNSHENRVCGDRIQLCGAILLMNDQVRIRILYSNSTDV